MTRIRRGNLHNVRKQIAESVDVTTLGNLTDVSIVSVTDGEVLVYESASSSWRNRTFAEANIQAQDALLDSIATLSDPNADRILFWDDSANSFAWLTAGTGLTITGTTINAAGGAEQLSELTDVGVTTPTNRNALLADGDSWESRAIVEADISDLQSYLLSADIADFETTTELNARDTANRSRANHTGTQLASTISDFSTAVAAAETNDLTASVTWANIPDANVPETAVTQHQAALTITESQISDLGSYITGVAWGDVTGTLSSQTDLQSALNGKANVTHFHAASYITSGTFADARIAESNVTQHESALEITLVQVSDYSATAGQLNFESDPPGAAQIGSINMSGSASTDMTILSVNQSTFAFSGIRIVSFPGDDLEVNFRDTGWEQVFHTGNFTDNSADWNTAFGWGDHSTEGYLTTVTNADMANMAANTIKGRQASTGAPQDLTAAQARTLLNVEDGSTADQTDAEIETAYNNQVSVVSQAEAEAGTATTVRRWTAERVAQAIAALGGGGGGGGGPTALAQSSNQTINHTTYTAIPGLSFSATANTDYHFMLTIEGNNFDQGSARFRIGGTASGLYTAREAASLATALGSTTIDTGSLTVSIDASFFNQIWHITGVIKVTGTAGTVNVQFQEVANGSFGYTIQSGAWIVHELT